MFRRFLGSLSRCIYFPVQSPGQEQAEAQAQVEAPHEEPKVKIVIPNPSIEWKNCKPFVPPISSGYVIKVYDGDTITIASKLPYPESALYRFAVRLNGIDTPEIKGKTEDEKKSAQAAKHALENLILDKNVILKNIQTEKYGRILADVYLNQLHLNQWMLDNKYAVPYDGGTKKSPDSWLDYNTSTDPPTTSDVKGKKPHSH